MKFITNVDWVDSGWSLLIGGGCSEFECSWKHENAIVYFSVFQPGLLGTEVLPKYFWVPPNISTLILLLFMDIKFMSSKKCEHFTP
jgi:hypothetical protein